MNPRRPWLRLWNSTATDSKIHGLSALEFKIWIFTLIAANEEGRDGLVRDAVDTIAVVAKTRRDAVDNALGSFRDREIISRSSRDITVVNWGKYQAFSPLTKAETEEELSRDNGALDQRRPDTERNTYAELRSAPSKTEQNDCRKRAEEVFTGITGIKPPANKKEAGKLWWTPLREICELAQWKPSWIERLIQRSIQEQSAAGFNIGSPNSIIKKARSIAAKANMKQNGRAPEREVVAWHPITGELVYAEE